ncbi:hypothetical protein E3N88_03016 [Mikania micrantha]|uniref:Magnesium transporter n=1 Tax=Mikania micrantha TaxID=192012 RepID=A0A5N6Q872_9ASTR|nr:hypothetical protein E3N88_03016 [Mikania micrantha]
MLPLPLQMTSSGDAEVGAAGIRPWLLLDSTGHAQIIEAGKHAIMRRTGLPARDFRILDPILSYPSTVLGRERAIVINLEHIKAIITAQEVLLLNSKDPSVTTFVDELQRRILRHHQATSQFIAVKSITSLMESYCLVLLLAMMTSVVRFRNGFKRMIDEIQISKPLKISGFHNSYCPFSVSPQKLLTAMAASMGEREIVEFFTLGDLRKCFDEWGAHGTGISFIVSGH